MKTFCTILILVLGCCSCLCAQEALTYSLEDVAPVYTWRTWLTVVIVFVVFIALIAEVLPADLTMFSGACLLVITTVLSPQGFLRGFSQSILFTLAMLFIIARTLEVNGVLTYISRYIMPRHDGYRRELATIMAPLGVASAFFNNTPVVLMLTSTVRKWALEKGQNPSRYLMPISFIAILGGMCTLIGTSTNIIVNGLVTKLNPEATLSFFDFALVGVPCLVVGYLYLVFIGSSLLPDRRDPSTTAKADARHYTSEFLVLEESPLVGKTLREAGRRYFQQDYLIEIVRNGRSMSAPVESTVIHADDRLVFASDIAHIANLHAIQGLQSQADPQFQLDVAASHVAEVVVAVNSWLIGKSLRRAAFRTTYGASVVAVYRGGQRVLGPVGDVVLHPGDTLILLSNKPWTMEPRFRNDLYPIRHSRELPIFKPRRALFVSAVLLALIVLVSVGFSIFYISLCAASLLVVTRFITFRQARQAIDWHLLLLIASAFAVGEAMYDTGVAHAIAQAILAVVGTNPYMLIGGIFLATMAITEVITNNAAALLLFPVALRMMMLSGYDSVNAIKAVGMTVAVAASSSFLTPIGYQTNTIVYGPGGYRFLDYARVGSILSILVFFIGTFLIPYWWPLT